MNFSLKNFSTRYALTLLVMTALVMPMAAEAFVTTSDMPINATNMVPDSSASGSFAVENITGFSQKAGIQIASTTGDFAMFADQMTFTISGDFAASGDLGDLTIPFELSTIPDGSTHNYTLTLTLKSDAPQDPLMGKSFGFDLIVGLEEGSTVIVPVITNNDDRRRGSSGGYMSSRTITPVARVLGASTDTCEQLLYTYIHPNRQNDVAEVTKLQTFLRDLEGHFDLEVNGVYDQATQDAVYEFQQKYADRVLTPWGLPLPTRFVYYTTRKMVNEIHCDFKLQFPLTADQQSEIAWYRDQGVAYRQSSGQLSETSSNGKGMAEGVTTTVKEVIGTGEEVVSGIGEQAAAAVSAGAGFFGSIWNWFKSIFSR